MKYLLLILLLITPVVYAKDVILAKNSYFLYNIGYKPTQNFGSKHYISFNKILSKSKITYDFIKFADGVYGYTSYSIKYSNMSKVYRKNSERLFGCRFTNTHCS